jgi:hypothetical protein
VSAEVARRSGCREIPLPREAEGPSDTDEKLPPALGADPDSKDPSPRSEVGERGGVRESGEMGDGLFRSRLGVRGGDMWCREGAGEPLPTELPLARMDGIGGSEKDWLAKASIEA